MSAIKNGKLFVKSENNLTIYDLPIEIAPLYDFSLDLAQILRFVSVEEFEKSTIEWPNISCFDSNGVSIIVGKGIQMKLFNLSTLEAYWHAIEASNIECISIHPTSLLIATMCNDTISLWSIDRNQKVKQVMMHGLANFTDNNLILRPSLYKDRIYKFDIHKYSIDTITFESNIEKMLVCNGFCLIYLENQIRVLDMEKDWLSNISCTRDIISIKSSINDPELFLLAVSGLLTRENIDFYSCSKQLYAFNGKELASFTFDYYSNSNATSNALDITLNRLAGILNRQGSESSSNGQKIEFILQTRKEILSELLNIWNHTNSNGPKDITNKVKAAFKEMSDTPVRIDVFISFSRILLRNSRIWLDIQVGKLALQLIRQLFINCSKSDSDVLQKVYKDDILRFIKFITESLKEIIVKTLQYKNDPIMQLALSSQERVESCLEIVNLLKEMHHKCVWMPIIEF